MGMALSITSACAFVVAPLCALVRSGGSVRAPVPAHLSVRWQHFLSWVCGGRVCGWCAGRMFARVETVCVPQMDGWTSTSSGEARMSRRSSTGNIFSTAYTASVEQFLHHSRGLLAVQSPARRVAWRGEEEVSQGWAQCKVWGARMHTTVLPRYWHRACQSCSPVPRTEIKTV